MKRMKKMVSALLALLLLTSLSVPAALAADKVYRETTKDVFLRAGAGTQFDKKTTIPKGDVVVVTNSMYADWWHVSYTNAKKQTYDGYVMSKYLKVTKKRSNEKKNTAPLGCYYAVSAANLRSGPGASYKKRTTVPANNVVDVIDTTDELWYKVNFINKKGKKFKGGYISARSLKKAAEPYNVKSKTELRKSASKSSKSLCVMPKGAYVSVTSFYSKKWYKLSYKDINNVTHVGFALKSKLKKGTVTNKPYKQVDPEAEAKYMAKVWRSKGRYQLTGKATLTATASKKGKKVANLSKGAVVAVDSKKGKFWKVVWNDSRNKKKTGYLPKDKLKEFKDPNGGTYVTTAVTELRLDDKQDSEVLVRLEAYTLFKVKDSTEKSWLWGSYTDSSGKKHTGFVFKKHAKKYEEKNAGDYCTNAVTELRSTASDSGKVVKNIPAGVLVKVKKTYNPNWYYLNYTDEKGNFYEGFAASYRLWKVEARNLSYVASVDTALYSQPDSPDTKRSDIKAGQAVIVNDLLSSVLNGRYYWVSFTNEAGETKTGFAAAADLMTKEEYDAAQQVQQEPQPAPQEEEQEPQTAPSEEPAEEEPAAQAPAAGEETPSEELAGTAAPEEAPQEEAAPEEAPEEAPQEEAAPEEAPEETPQEEAAPEESIPEEASGEESAPEAA